MFFWVFFPFFYSFFLLFFYSFFNFLIFFLFLSHRIFVFITLFLTFFFFKNLVARTPGWGVLTDLKSRGSGGLSWSRLQARCVEFLFIATFFFIIFLHSFILSLWIYLFILLFIYILIQEFYIKKYYYDDFTFMCWICIWRWFYFYHVFVVHDLSFLFFILWLSVCLFIY